MPARERIHEACTRNHTHTSTSNSSVWLLRYLPLTTPHQFSSKAPTQSLSAILLHWGLFRLQSNCRYFKPWSFLCPTILPSIPPSLIPFHGCEHAHIMFPPTGWVTLHTQELHSASSHIQSKILSAAAAASQHPNTTPKFPPADVQKPELSTQKKSKPKKKKPPSSSLRSVVLTQSPKFTHGSPSLLPKSRLPQTPTLLPWPKSELKKANKKKKKNLSQ